MKGPVEAQWEDLRRHSLPADAPRSMLDVCRKMFYSGALCMMGMYHEAAADPDDQALSKLDLVEENLREFYESVQEEVVAQQQRGDNPVKGMIFVFGSNLSGIHGAGAAKFANEQRGAEWGVGEGRTGQSYALPTKEADVATSRPLGEVTKSAAKFIQYAEDHPELQFQLTAVGCGLAGFKSEDIAPLFSATPDNVHYPPEWTDHLPHVAPERFWSYD